MQRGVARDALRYFTNLTEGFRLSNLEGKTGAEVMFYFYWVYTRMRCRLSRSRSGRASMTGAAVPAAENSCPPGGRATARFRSAGSVRASEERRAYLKGSAIPRRCVGDREEEVLCRIKPAALYAGTDRFLSPRPVPPEWPRRSATPRASCRRRQRPLRCWFGDSGRPPHCRGGRA